MAYCFSGLFKQFPEIIKNVRICGRNFPMLFKCFLKKWEILAVCGCETADITANRRTNLSPRSLGSGL